jgi:hypothetical protein
MTAAKYNKSRTESLDQRALAQYLDAARLLWMHVPNEGKRSKVYGHLLKLAGLKSGVPDNFIFNSPPNLPCCKGAAIELKRVNGGIASDEQKQWITDLENNGWVACVAYGLDDALNYLRKWGYLIGDKQSRQEKANSEKA